jgi:hypothetical protein
MIAVLNAEFGTLAHFDKLQRDRKFSRHKRVERCVHYDPARCASDAMAKKYWICARANDHLNRQVLLIRQGSN